MTPSSPDRLQSDQVFKVSMRPPFPRVGWQLARLLLKGRRGTRGVNEKGDKRGGADDLIVEDTK